MAKIFRGWTPFILATTLLAALTAAALLHRKHPSNTSAADLQAHAAIASAPNASGPAAATRSASSKVVGSYLDVVKAQYLTFSATQPLGIPVEFSQAAHLVLHDPIYFSGMSRAEMWITRPDGPDAPAALAEAADETKDVDVHVLRERVAFVHWMPRDDGKWAPWLVCHKNGGFEVVSVLHGWAGFADQTCVLLGELATSWDDKVIVPSARGVSIFRFGPVISESYHELASPQPGPKSTGATSEPRVIFIRHGLTNRQDLIAWMPWEAGKIGGGAARFSSVDTTTSPATRPDGTWTDLTGDAGWPRRILHLVPMLDGTVLMLSIDEKGGVGVSYNTLDRVAVNEQDVGALVDQLSDADQKQRDAAYEKLSQYGPGIWPILEKLAPDQTEAKSRLRQLLKQRVVPTLSGMSLLGKRTVTIASRLSDGGTVFYAEAGVALPHPDSLDAQPDYRVPAWISIRPADIFRPLPERLTDELTPGISMLHPNGEPHAEVWIVTGDGKGPREFVGNGFVKLLRKSEQAFSIFIGIDRRGRWLFRKPVGSSPATAASTSPVSRAAETLIIDPTLPDPTPRLPVWVFNTADTVGWTKEGWPVAKKGSAYALRETDWESMEENEPMYSTAEDVPAPVEISSAPPATTALATSRATSVAIAPAIPAATAPTTRPVAIATTTPATSQTSSDGAERPILTDRNGNRYFGGLTDLRVVGRSGKQTIWTLPAIASGKGPAWLVRTSDGRLFLFNQGGRVLRIKPTPDGAEPFALEKIFTHRIPTVDRPTRVWLDPAGRIIMAWDNQLAIFFPGGYIPPAIAEKMVKDENDDDE